MRIHVSFIAGSIVLMMSFAQAETPKTSVVQEEQSPSFQQKTWTGTKMSYEGTIEYNFVGGASQNMGDGLNDNLRENYFATRHVFQRRTMLAFLVQTGFEYQHMSFNPPDDKIVPGRLDQLDAIAGLDFRWSRKDLLHFQARPGVYTDFRDASEDDLNAPLEIGYTRVVSDSFQWVIGMSINTWRKNRYLGGAGFRWKVNDRWKLRCFMPTPQIEYKAREDLHVFMGAEFRGETYRVSKTFGTDKGNPRLNNALVDYQEIRVGPGFSWNIKPLIELNGSAGYMIGRQFDFHTGGPTLRGSGAPYVNLQIHMLFKLPGEISPIPHSDNISISDIFKYF